MSNNNEIQILATEEQLYGFPEKNEKSEWVIISPGFYATIHTVRGTGIVEMMFYDGNNLSARLLMKQ